MKKRIFLLLIPFLLMGCQKKETQESESPSIFDSESESEPLSESPSDSESITESESEPESESEGESESESEPPIVHEFYDYDGYYDQNFSWDDSIDLIDKLHTLISTDVTYSKYEGNWAINQNADQDLYDHEMVNLLYSYDTDLKTNTYSNGNGWQKEHAFAASLMTGFTSGDAVTVGSGRAVDFHNLFAASYSGNTSRGNKNFGAADVNAEDGSYQDRGAYSFDSKNFEPSDDDKGLLSRALMYMVVMYNQEESVTVKTTLNYNDEDKATYGKASTTISVPVTYKPLSLVDEYVNYSKVSYTNWYYQNDVYGKDEDLNDVLITDVHALIEEYGEGVEGYARYSEDNCQFAIGNKQTVIDWANCYVVSKIEMQHNDKVYLTQGNRNPFVDYPELIAYAFGDKVDESGSLKDLEASYYDLAMDEEGISHYALTSAKREFDVGETITNEDFTIKEVNNDLTLGAEYVSDYSYTFTSGDALLGSVERYIPTPLNFIKLVCKVNSGTFNSCSYQYEIIGSAASTQGSEFVNYTSGKEVNLGGTIWTFTWTNPNGAIGSKDKTYGLAFGKNDSSRVNELAIETVEAMNLSAVYFKGSTASGKTANYKIFVGDTLVSSGTFTRESGAPSVIGVNFAQTTGRIKIVINGNAASTGAIYIHSLAYNEID